jgi:hypothetical protein
MAAKAGFIARIKKAFRLVADFVVLILIGALWVPLQMSQQQRPIQPDPAEVEDGVQHSSRDAAKRTPEVE